MKTLLLFCLMVSGVIPVVAQEFSNPDLMSMVQAERNFSNMAQDKNIREAFLTYSDESSIGMDKGPVSLKQRWETRKADTARLWWEPEYVDISFSGDFGISTGPWEYGAGKNSKVLEYGHFFTVWKRDANKNWKILIDAGISHAGPTFHYEVATTGLPLIKSTPGGDEKTLILGFEKELADGIKKSGNKAYSRYLSDEARFYFSGYAPVLTKPLLEKFLKDRSGKLDINMADVLVANSGDMAASYGTVSIETLNEGKPQTVKAGILHVWKKEQEKSWKLLAEVLSL